MPANLVECFVGIKAWRQARIDLGACLVRENGFHAFTGVATPDAINVQRRLVQELDDSISAGLPIDPVIDGQHLEQLRFVAIFDTGIYQQ